MASAVSTCPECGHQFRPEKRQLVTVAGEDQIPGHLAFQAG